MKGTKVFWWPATLTIALLLTLAPVARGQAPCCSITTIDAKTGIVSAKVNATGAAFQFKVTDAAEFKTLKVGQAVYANLAAKEVSLNGKRIVGPIVSMAASLGKPSGSSSAGGTASGSAPSTTSGGTSQPSGSSTSTPANSTPFPPMTSAARLAAIPIPAALLSGAAKCSANYGTANSLLDVLIGGCTVNGVMTEVAPAQPDISDPAAAPAGAGGPYKLTNNANHVVTTCKDKTNAVVSLPTCLKAAAYSGSALANAARDPQTRQQLLQLFQ